jgi:hypothetical protein
VVRGIIGAAHETGRRKPTDASDAIGAPADGGWRTTALAPHASVSRQPKLSNLDNLNVQLGRFGRVAWGPAIPSRRIVPIFNVGKTVPVETSPHS